MSNMQTLVILYCLQNNNKGSQAVHVQYGLDSWLVEGAFWLLLFLVLQMVDLWVGTQCFSCVHSPVTTVPNRNNLKERDFAWFMV